MPQIIPQSWIIILVMLVMTLMIVNSALPLLTQNITSLPANNSNTLNIEW